MMDNFIAQRAGILFGAASQLGPYVNLAAALVGCKSANQNVHISLIAVSCLGRVRRPLSHALAKRKSLTSGRTVGICDREEHLCHASYSEAAGFCDLDILAS
jgi:hypothetical protein